MAKITVMCMKWGTVYGPEYVNILEAMVKRNLTLEHEFVCLTDDTTGIHDHIKTMPIPDINTGSAHSHSGWTKMTSLSNELGFEGTVLFLDVDLIITGNIDCFFEYKPGEFCIIENWTKKNRMIGNSSVYRFEAGKHHDIFETLNNDPEKAFSEYTSSQDYMTKMVDKKQTVYWWPDEICRSFKRHSIPKGIMRYLVKPKLPDDCRILVFHGPPKPMDAVKGIYKKHLKPSPWILDYWRE